MEPITLAPNFSTWQRAARCALHLEVPPDEISWEEIAANQPGLNLVDENDASGAQDRQFRVPKKFVDLARVVALHRNEHRWALLYRLLWRLIHGEPNLLKIFADADTALALDWEKSVRHDIHKMRAFVRFREVTLENARWFVAWFEPQHHIVEHNAQFFVERFASMKWSILTPGHCAHWDGTELTFSEGVLESDAPTEDEVERLWLTYYANIFKPGRIKVHAMQAEMPKRYWRNLPETAVIPTLLREAPARVDVMMKRSAAKRMVEEDGEEW